MQAAPFANFYGRDHCADGPSLAHKKIWVPHLRDSLIVAKVGIRATREPLSSPDPKKSVPETFTDVYFNWRELTTSRK
jgi:hypothetical protein